MPGLSFLFLCVIINFPTVTLPSRIGSKRRGAVYRVDLQYIFEILLNTAIWNSLLFKIFTIQIDLCEKSFYYNDQKTIPWSSQTKSTKLTQHFTFLFTEYSTFDLMLSAFLCCWLVSAHTSNKWQYILLSESAVKLLNLQN